MSNPQESQPSEASPVEEVSIKLRNINTGDNAIVKCQKDSQCTPLSLFHKAGWGFVKEDATIMVSPENIAVTPSVLRTFNEGDVLILSNKGTTAGL